MTTTATTPGTYTYTYEGAGAYTVTAQDTPQAIVRGYFSQWDNSQASHVEISMFVDTRETAQMFVATLPKSLRVRATTMSLSGSQLLGMVSFRVSLNADGVNGGVNETGVKRYRRYLKALADAGVEVKWDNEARCTNSYASPEEFEAALTAATR